MYMYIYIYMYTYVFIDIDIYITVRRDDSLSLLLDDGKHAVLHKRKVVVVPKKEKSWIYSC